MPTRRERVDHAVRAVRDFHAVGQRSLHAYPGRGPYGTRAAEAETLGTSGEYVRKARAFADPERGYTRADLAALCRAVRARFDAFTARGATFGTTHVIRLLAVPKAGGKRAQMEARLFAGGWSTDELEAAIRQRFGRRRQGGRPRRRVGDRPGLLAQADLVTRSWLRWFEQVGRPDVAGRKKTPLDVLPAPVRGAIRAAARALAAVRDVVGAELD